MEADENYTTMTLDETYSKWLLLQPLTEKELRMLRMRFTMEYNYNSNRLEGNSCRSLHGREETLASHQLSKVS